ncbi:asialoglycoprotein receptor 1 [Protobothrops mucrosquamatus]|uniref:asialoglycoprotein receptor 1 n=1 Tax=Protobothrops mucrosquamatus TaxID=103944 RepID=UPI0007759502|nr:asialoglycoprotein receptor 1 [Protobothrops mucrosquamatus]
MAGFAPQNSWRQRVCSARRVILVLMGLLAVVTLSITVFGFVGCKYSTPLWKMQEDLKAINSTIAAELDILQQNETNILKTLQKIDQMVKNLTEETKEVNSQFGDQIKKLQGTLEQLKCDLENTKHKGTGSERGCCPWGWYLFQQSCYWLSSAQTSWTEAKQDCEEKEAHLVVITNHLEKQFVFRLTKQDSVWIGLKFDGRTWKWVDGTPYTMSRADWWSHGSMHYDQYCTKTYRDGLWNEVNCPFHFRWMCEMQALQ